jgi:putative nucleotidyltransferase with HDIG domain
VKNKYIKMATIYHKEEINKLFDKTKELFEDHINKKELRNHCLEVEIIMRFLAKELEEDEEKWAMTGKLHDLDFENLDMNNPEDMKVHGKITADKLNKADYPQDMIHAVLAHNEENTGVKRENKFDYCLCAADNISGLIYAYGLMRGGLDDMKVKGLKKKMKDKTFAAAVRRDLILDIEKVMDFDKFLEVSIKAMQSISEEIGFEG